MKTLIKSTYTLFAACLILLTWSACGDMDDVDNPEPGATVQSQCKPSSKADGLSGGKVKAEAKGTTVTVRHIDAHYNCSSKLQLLVSVSNFEILAKEVITNPGELARCMCDYDLSVPVSNLAPGTYKVTVQDADGKVAGSTSVKVDGGVVVTSSIQSACKAPPAKKTFSAGAVKVTVAGGDVTILH